MQNDLRKAIFLDIDGTLVTGGNHLSDFDIAQLNRAREAGHLIFLNTGRSLAYIQPWLRDAPYVDGIIAGGGAHVLLRGQTLHHTTIPADQLVQIASLYMSINKWCKFEGETENYAVNFAEQTAEKIFSIGAPEDFLEKYRGARITKITMQDTLTDPERELLHPWFYLYKMNGYSEGIIRGESKTNGIRIMLEATGISPENTVGIGDSDNDIEMIMNVAFGIAMDNAVTELKQVAHAITDDCRHNGVGNAIIKYVLT